MGVWYKFALDASANSASIYMNGQKLASISQTNTPATASVSVGIFWGNGVYTGNLYIDNVQINTSAPPPIPTWSKTYGGGSGNSVVQTSDGGYALAYDGGLFKTDAYGTVLWNKTYGVGVGYSVVQSSDGGYAIAGDTSSYGAGGSDVYLIKTDSLGNILWNKTYGGTGNERGSSVVQSSDGGYAIAGFTNSFGGGGPVVYLVKTDSAGNMQWNKTYGAIDGNSVVQTSDGGYAIAGITMYYDAGSYPVLVYLVKTDAYGTMQWSKTYGVTSNPLSKASAGYSVVQTSDGGYAIAGYTNSPGSGGSVGYLVKTDANGNVA
jgi:hypothetical protein